MTEVKTKRRHLHLTRKIRACTAIHQLSYSPSFTVYSVLNSMSANDTTGGSCADIFYTTSTSEHTPVSSILASPDIESPARSRKRKRNEGNWKDSKRKRAFNLGAAYVNRKDRQILKKAMKAGCGEIRRMKCQDRIGICHRKTVFHYFWRTENFDKRRGYVCTNVEESSKKARRQ